MGGALSGRCVLHQFSTQISDGEVRLKLFYLRIRLLASAPRPRLMRTKSKSVHMCTDIRIHFIQYVASRSARKRRPSARRDHQRGGDFALKGKTNVGNNRCSFDCALVAWVFCVSRFQRSNPHCSRRGPRCACGAFSERSYSSGIKLEAKPYPPLFKASQTVVNAAMGYAP